MAGLATDETSAPRGGEVIDADVIHDEAPAGPSPDGVLGRVISDDTSPAYGEIRFRLTASAVVAPGQFVAIEAAHQAGASLVLARVLDVHEVNPHEDALSSMTREVVHFDSVYSPEGRSTVIYRLVRTEPIEELPLTQDGSPGDPHEVRTLPRAGSPVFAASPDLVVAALGLPTGPAGGLDVGTLHSDASVPVRLHREAAQRHILIVGGIGSGKSYTRGVLAEELHAHGAPQVNIDVNGEMITAAGELGGITVRPGDGFTLPLGSLTREDLLEAVTGVRGGTNIETLVGYAFDVLQRAAKNGTGSAQFSVADLVAKIDEVAPDLQMQAANTLRPAVVRAQNLERLPYLGAPFDWAVHLGPGGFVNIDCRGLPLSDLRIVTAAVARDLQSLARGRAIPFTVLSIDEFHLVAPNEDRIVSTQVLREIARIGRHYRLGLILTTQSPADVDRSILKRLLTRFIHSIERDQLDSLRGVFDDAPPEVIASLSKMPSGTCLLTGVAETIRHATVVDVRPRRTTHGGSTPDVWAQLAAWSPPDAGGTP